ncbi:hypothetical protein N7449_012497 [Penicillium cf. viridicatum]|uniref:Uncharacterized protein n=1 Tax=Penicillium cf. viridicatum TaxID=2972119 RepID=A0A9W9LYJ7_9EURO|nr:hypothetical protein N7449_012497 [Penicillium cf. viridicatum]
MARIKDAFKISRMKWSAQRYRDHANQPAVLMAKRATNLDALIGPIPEIAIQVYSTVPLDLDPEHDYTALCQYLSSGIQESPQLSFEIYGPQPDVFTCVKHQRREILHQKNNFPEEGFFPGIAKVAPNKDRLLQASVLMTDRIMKLNQVRYGLISIGIFRSDPKLISVPGLSVLPI